MQVELLTAVQPQTGETAQPPALPAAWDFHPEAAPYQVSFPSGLAAPPEETATRPETESAEDGDAARLRGVIMHRALQTLALGGDRAGCACPGRGPPAGGDVGRRGRLPGRGNSGGTRGLPGGPVPDLPPAAGYPPGGQRVAPGRPTPAGRHPPGGDRPFVLRRPATGGSWITRPPAPPPGRTGRPSSPGRPRNTGPNSWPTGRWRPRPGELNRRRPSGWFCISLPASGRWKCNSKFFGFQFPVFGYKKVMDS